MITCQNLIYCSYFKHYSSLNWKTLSETKFHHDEKVITENTLCFWDLTGAMQFTGNELFAYPDLAIKLREFSDYPKMKREYPASKELKEMSGIGFLSVFTQLVQASHETFTQEKIKINAVINHAIAEHGNNNAYPVIESVERWPAGSIKTLTIHGVDWQLTDSYNMDQPLKTIYLSKLPEIKDLKDLKRIRIEDALIGSTFIALRLFIGDSKNGRMVWYCLHRQKIVPLRVINRIRETLKKFHAD